MEDILVLWLRYHKTKIWKKMKNSVRVPMERTDSKMKQMLPTQVVCPQANLLSLLCTPLLVCETEMVAVPRRLMWRLLSDTDTGRVTEPQPGTQWLFIAWEWPLSLLESRIFPGEAPRLLPCSLWGKLPLESCHSLGCPLLCWEWSCRVNVGVKCLSSPGRLCVWVVRLTCCSVIGKGIILWVQRR